MTTCRNNTYSNKKMFLKLACICAVALIATTTATLTVEDEKLVATSSKITCPKCQEYAGILVSVVNNTALFPEVIALAEGECAKKYPNSTSDQKLCKDVIGLAAKLLPKLLKGMEGLDWNIPNTVCADIVKVCRFPCCSASNQPEQIHLAFAFSDSFLDYRVTWVTLTPTELPTQIKFAPMNSTGSSVVGEEATRTYTQGGWIGTVHTAVLSNLMPETTYTYQFGTNGSFAGPIYTFYTMAANKGTPTNPLRIVTIADMGFGPNSNNTISQIEALVNARQVDFVVHSGDISYADGDEHHWDLFFTKMQGIITQVPYMTVPGNHEFYWNFSAYQTRLGQAMPRASNGAEGAMYYTLKVGPVQMVMLDSETYIDTADIDPLQQNWAKDVMSVANANRTATPWLLAFQHRPLYCTSDPALQCEIFGGLLQKQVEEIYYENKVDLSFAGHMHNWERMYPTYKGQVVSSNYTQPQAPVYIVNGAAGNREGNGMPKGNKPWSAFHSKVIGYSVYTISSDAVSNDHILNVQFFESADNTVLDQFTITKSL